MVEGARLESVYTGNRIAGSNPASSASLTSMAAPIHMIAARHKDPRAGEHPLRIHIRFILSWLNTSYQRGGAFVPAL